MLRRVAAGLALVAVGGCGAETGRLGQPAAQKVYGGIQTRLLDDDLVNFRVSMRGAEGPVDLRLYAECAAAQYALIRGFDFVRHVRTTVEEEGGNWTADAVYTVSPGLPQGLQTIDAGFTVATCERAGVPTV
ncbi:hypothetical protein [Histidinibacterium lentulum]|uniref:Lipoprotein n=1 Tax=Histidinibacterium lentulum TaxID=2480588 RepID=A0A3N2QTL8_9RHOB|nr:hypothetical protein [Histidinibacterium lentulum]ROT98510.1 hypothetical protein EAT49_16340 [Histidinibacterium lentulum]